MIHSSLANYLVCIGVPDHKYLHISTLQTSLSQFAAQQTTSSISMLANDGIMYYITRPSSLAYMYHIPRIEGLGMRLSSNLTILAIVRHRAYSISLDLKLNGIAVLTFPGKQHVGWNWQWHDRRRCELVPSPSHQEAPQPIPCPILEREREVIPTVTVHHKAIGAWRPRHARALPGLFRSIAYSYHKDRTRRHTACPSDQHKHVYAPTDVRIAYSVVTIHFRNCGSNAA